MDQLSLRQFKRWSQRIKIHRFHQRPPFPPHSDKFNALKSVLEATDFFGKLDKACESSGKSKEDFAIIVKPNFMFMYSTKDPSTYTDPELVEYLVTAMYDCGYRNLAVGEARSTYGTFLPIEKSKQ